MNQHLLIMGTRYTPLKDLIEAAVDHDYRVTTAPTGDQDFDEYLRNSSPETVTQIQLRLGSTLSTRVAVASALHTPDEPENQIRDVILVVSPPQEARGFHEIPPGEMEQLLQENLLGMLYVLRETMAVLTAQGQGSITVVLDEHSTDVLPALGSGVLYGIQRTVEGMFRSYQNKLIVIQGVRSQCDNQEMLARYMFDEYFARPEKNGYRWTKFTGRSGLFTKKGMQ